MSSTPSADTWRAASVRTNGAAPDGTQMDTVELLVRDLDAMTDYYHRAVTLDVLDQSGATTVLGRGTQKIMTLRQEKDLPTGSPRSAGLYHTAILFQDEHRLAASLRSMAERVPHAYAGSADHLVSEAFYFTDPEGNGLELYHDRPRDQWNVLADGSVQMESLPLDPNDFLHRWLRDEDAVAQGDTATIGHVHLQVGDIPSAKRFYVDVLGFDVTADLGSALFVSAGGYHHHIGMNTWNSAGAGPRAASLGLGDVRIVVPTRDDVETLGERVRSHGIDSADDGRALHLSDPWGTRLVIAPSNAS